MAESTKRIILKIDFEGSNAIQQTVALKKELAGYRKEMDDLNTALAKKEITQEKYAVSMEVLNAQIKDNQRETRTVTKFIDDATRAITAETGSLEANRKKYSELNAEYVRMANPTKAQTKNLKDLNDTIKKQESALGDNRRNVGNYADGLQGLGGPIGNAVKGIKGVNTALGASPILLIVSLLGFLGGALAKLEPFMDTIAEAMGALNAVFDVLIERAKQFLSGNFIAAFSGIGDAIENAAIAGRNYARALEEIENRSKVLSIINSENSKQLAILAAQLRDTTKTDKERLAIADEITAREKANLELNQKNLKQTLKAEEERVRNALKAAEVNDEFLLTTEDLIKASTDFNIEKSVYEKLLTAQIALTDSEKESLAITERVEVRRNAILQQATEARQKEHDKELKRIDIETKAKEKQVQDFINLSKKEFEETRKNTDFEFKEKELLAKEKYSKGLLSESEYQSELKQIKLDSLNEQLLDLQDYSETVPELHTAISEKEIEIKNATLDAVIANNNAQKASNEELIQNDIAIHNAKLDLAASLVNSIGGFLSLDVENKKRYGAILKTLAIAEIAINLQRELSAISVYAAAHPANVITLGAAGGITYTTNSIIAIIRAALATATVLKKGFKDGGYTGEGNTSSVSTSLGDKPYTYHKDEYVVPSKILNSPQGSAHVKALEAMRLSNPSGLAYLGGMADGGFSQRVISSGVNTSLQALEMIEAFKSMPTPVVRVTDIIKVTNNRDNTISVSEL